MSANAYQWVWQQNIQHAPSKLVLVTLADMANPEGLCWPSAKLLSIKTGLAIGTVRMCLRKLRLNGYIKSAARTRVGNNGNTSNYYILQLEAYPKWGCYTVTAPPAMAEQPPLLPRSTLEPVRKEPKSLNLKTSLRKESPREIPKSILNRWGEHTNGYSNGRQITVPVPSLDLF